MARRVCLSFSSWLSGSACASGQPTAKAPRLTTHGAPGKAMKQPALRVLERHRPCVVRMEWSGSGPTTRTLCIAGKGVNMVVRQPPPSAFMMGNMFDPVESRSVSCQTSQGQDIKAQMQVLEFSHQTYTGTSS